MHMLYYSKFINYSNANNQVEVLKNLLNSTGNLKKKSKCRHSALEEFTIQTDSEFRTVIKCCMGEGKVERMERRERGRRMVCNVAFCQPFYH